MFGERQKHTHHRATSVNFADNDGCYEGNCKANSKAPARCPALQNKSKVKSANQEFGAPGKGKTKARRPTKKVGRYKGEGKGKGAQPRVAVPRGWLRHTTVPMAASDCEQK